MTRHSTILSAIITLFVSQSLMADLTVDVTAGKNWAYSTVPAGVTQNWNGNGFTAETAVNMASLRSPGAAAQSYSGFLIQDTARHLRYCVGLANTSKKDAAQQLTLGVLAYESGNIKQGPKATPIKISDLSLPTQLLKLKLTYTPATSEKTGTLKLETFLANTWREVWSTPTPLTFAPDAIGLVADGTDVKRHYDSIHFKSFTITGNGPAQSDDFGYWSQGLRWQNNALERTDIHRPSPFRLVTDQAKGLQLTSDDILPALEINNPSNQELRGTLSVSAYRPAVYKIGDKTNTPRIQTGSHTLPIVVPASSSLKIDPSMIRQLPPGVHELDVELANATGQKASNRLQLAHFPGLKDLVEKNGNQIAQLKKQGIPVAYLDADQALTELLLLDLQNGHLDWYVPAETTFGFELAKSLPQRIAEWEKTPAMRTADPIWPKAAGIHVKDGAFFNRDGLPYFLNGTYFTKGFPEDGVDTAARYRRLGVNNNNLNSWPWTTVEEVATKYAASARECMNLDISFTYQINQKSWFDQSTWDHWEPRLKALDGFENNIGYCVGNEMWLPSAAWKRPYRVIGPTQAWRADMRVIWKDTWDQDQIAAFHAHLKNRFGSIGRINQEYGTSFTSIEEISLPLFRDYRGWNSDPANKTGQIDAAGLAPTVKQAGWIAYGQKRYATLEQLNEAYNTRFEKWEDLPPPSPIHPKMWADWADHINNKPLANLYADNSSYYDGITWAENEAALWTGYLHQKYGTIDKINARFGTTFRSVSELPPPSASNRIMWIDWYRYAHEYHFGGLFNDTVEKIRKTSTKLVHLKTGLNIGAAQSVRDEFWNGRYDFFGYGHTWTGSGPDHSTPSCSLLDLTRGANGFLPYINNEDHMIWDLLVADTKSWDGTIAEAPVGDFIAMRYPRSPEELRHNLLANTLHGQYGTQVYFPGPGRKDGYSRVLSFHQAMARTFLDTLRLAQEFHAICNAQRTAPVAILFDRDSDVTMNYWGASREYPLTAWQRQIMQITDELQTLGTPLRGITLEQIERGELSSASGIRVLVVPENNRRDPDVINTLKKVQVPVIWTSAQNARQKVDQTLSKGQDPRKLIFTLPQSVQWDGQSPMLQPAVDIKCVESDGSLLLWASNGTHMPAQYRWKKAQGFTPGPAVELFENKKIGALPDIIELPPYGMKLYQIRINK